MLIDPDDDIDIESLSPDEYAEYVTACDLRSELYEKAVNEFTAGRLTSFYITHPDLAASARRALREARRLISEHPSAALVFAATAVELSSKTVLLRPVVYGLVHQESVASLITELATSHTCFDKFRDLLFQLLAEHAAVDLRTFRREGASKTLWAEVSEVQSIRNAVLHRGREVSRGEAEHSIMVARALVEELIPSMLLKLGLHFHGEDRVCASPLCPSREHRDVVA